MDCEWQQQNIDCWLVVNSGPITVNGKSKEFENSEVLQNFFNVH